MEALKDGVRRCDSAPWILPGTLSPTLFMDRWTPCLKWRGLACGPRRAVLGGRSVQSGASTPCQGLPVEASAVVAVPLAGRPSRSTQRRRHPAPSVHRFPKTPGSVSVSSIGIGRTGCPSPSWGPPGGRDARSGRRGSHRLRDGKAYPRSEKFLGRNIGAVDARPPVPAPSTAPVESLR